MGVEIETITPGDGKIFLCISLAQDLMFFPLIHLNFHTKNAASHSLLMPLSCFSVASSFHARYPVFLWLFLPQEEPSLKKDRRVWCIMLVSLGDSFPVSVCMQAPM